MFDPQSGTDDWVVEQACKGDHVAFTSLFCKYQPGICSYLIGLVGNSEAYDLTQETFTRAFEHLSHLHNPARFKPWLYRIARNCAYDYLRRRQNNASISLEKAAEKDILRSSYDFSEAVAHKDLVQQALEQLPTKYRECLLLHIIAGLSAYDIASLVDLNENSVKTYLCNARKLFFQIYQQLVKQAGR
jgi:RNA polymerase sigma-70 factor, ECF subfamily